MSQPQEQRDTAPTPELPSANSDPDVGKHMAAIGSTPVPATRGTADFSSTSSAHRSRLSALVVGIAVGAAIAVPVLLARTPAHVDVANPAPLAARTDVPPIAAHYPAPPLPPSRMLPETPTLPIGDEPWPERAQPMAERARRAATHPTATSLSLHTDVTASVYLDGRLLGHTPLDFAAVPSGRHRLRLEADDGAMHLIPREEQLTLPSGRDTSLMFTLR